MASKTQNRKQQSRFLEKPEFGSIQINSHFLSD